GSDCRRHSRRARGVDPHGAKGAARRGPHARRRRPGGRPRREAWRRRDHAGRRIDRQPARPVARRARPQRHRSQAVSAVSAPADRRFRRAHVKPSRRRGRWHAAAKTVATCGVLAGLVAYGAYRASMVAAGAHVLQVDRIAVLGNQRLSKTQILAVLNGLRGANIVSTDLERWRRRLLASSWIRDAALRRSLPSTI